MQPFLKWKIKRLFSWTLAVIMLYLLMLKTFLRRADFLVTIDGASAEEAWNVLSDFSNYASLNTHLIDFDILDEVHDKSQVTQVQTLGLFWNYTVSYSEFYENLPKVMTNRAVGKYSVYLNATSFIIESEHVTCILPGWCLKSTGLDIFRSSSEAKTRSGKGCQLSETIHYECPFIMFPLCNSEVKKQRTKVLENLSNWNF